MHYVSHLRAGLEDAYHTVREHTQQVQKYQKQYSDKKLPMDVSVLAIKFGCILLQFLEDSHLSFISCEKDSISNL